MKALSYFGDLPVLMHLPLHRHTTWKEMFLVKLSVKPGEIFKLLFATALMKVDLNG